jgi:hypothetical protein
MIAFGGAAQAATCATGLTGDVSLTILGSPTDDATSCNSVDPGGSNNGSTQTTAFNTA